MLGRMPQVIGWKWCAAGAWTTLILVSLTSCSDGGDDRNKDGLGGMTSKPTGSGSGGSTSDGSSGGGSSAMGGADGVDFDPNEVFKSAPALQPALEDPEEGLTRVYVAVGYAGMRIRSTDGGLNWDSYQEDPLMGTECDGGHDKCILRGGTFGGGLFVAIGERFWTSPDGKNWTNRTPDVKHQWMGDVAYGNDAYLAVGGCGQAWSSPDTVTWTKTSTPIEGCGHLRSIAFGNGVFAAEGSFHGGDDISLVATNPNDITDVGFQDLRGMRFHDGVFRAGSRSEKNAEFHYASSDGKQWYRVDQPLPLIPVGDIYLRKNGDTIERSEEGENWDTVATGIDHSIQRFLVGDVKL